MRSHGTQSIRLIDADSGASLGASVGAYVRLLACILFIGMSLSACALIQPDAEALRTQAFSIAKDSGLTWSTHSAPGFDFAIATRITPGSERIHVYVEGDGNAFRTRRRVSSDPTPRNPVALRLLASDPHDSVIYVGRPCQYLAPERLDRCGPQFWTTSRYADSVVKAMDNALDNITALTGAQYPSLGLIGYSGGGTLAALLAARRADVEWLVTVAANLDHEAWVKWHRVTRLAGSITPVDNADALAALRQLHLLGARDNIVPPELARNFIASLQTRSEPGMIQMRVVPEFDHGCCWPEIWPQPLQWLSPPKEIIPLQR